MKISVAHSEPMTPAQAKRMSDFIAAAVDEAPGSSGPSMKAARLWINGEAFIIAGISIEGAGKPVGSVAVVFADHGEFASLSFAPHHGPEAKITLRRA
jgi:hypothetical protein